MTKPSRFHQPNNITTSDTHQNEELLDHKFPDKEVYRSTRQQSQGYYRFQLAWNFFVKALYSSDIRQQYDQFSDHYFDLFGQGQITYAQHLVDFVDNLLQTDQNRILDLGAGTGILSFPLSKRSKNLVSVDFSFNMLKKGIDSTSKSEAIIWKQADVCNLPFKLDSFDLVISCGLITHILPNTFSTFVKEMSRVVTKEGHIIINVPALPWRRIVGKKCSLKPNFLDHVIAVFYNKFHKYLGMNENRCGYNRKMVREEFLKNDFQVNFHVIDGMSIIHANKL